MNKHRLAQIAGLSGIASVLTISAGSFVLGQPENPMNPATPSSPSPSRPSQPSNPTYPPGVINPNQPTRSPSDLSQGRRLFMIETDQENRLRDFGQRMSRMETQMMETNDRLTRDLSDIRTLDTEQKVDKLTSVLQAIVNEHRQLHDYLVETRTALTGQLTGLTPAVPGSTTPGLSPSTTPGVSPTTTPGVTPSTPSRPGNPAPTPPRQPTSPP
jgi:hypothetical protein